MCLRLWCRALSSIAALALLLLPGGAYADDYPSRPMRIIVPLGQGSGADTTTRYIAERLNSVLGQPAIVENRPGADMLIGVQSLLNAPADGYSLMLLTPSSMVINPVINKSLPYDPQRDIRPLVAVSRGMAVMVTSTNSRFKTLSDVIAEARKAPKSVSLANYGQHYRLGGLLLERMAGVKFNHIPYKGASQVVTDLMGGSVDVSMIDAGGALPLIRAGKLRPLAVTGRERLAELPNVPSMRESGLPDFDLYAWIGFGVSSKTPEPIARKLEAALLTITAHPDFRAYVAQQGGGAEVISAPGKQLATMISAERSRYEALAKTLDGAAR